VSNERRTQVVSEIRAQRVGALEARIESLERELAGQKADRATENGWLRECRGKLELENTRAVVAERELAALKAASRMTEERAREIAVDSLKSAAPFGGQFYGLVVDAILAACREDSAALADENIEQAKQIVVLCNDLEYLGGIIERGGGTLDQDAPLTGQITGYVGNLERELAALVERNKALMAAAKFGLACVDAGHVCVNSEAVAAARAAVEEG